MREGFDTVDMEQVLTDEDQVPEQPPEAAVEEAVEAAPEGQAEPPPQDDEEKTTARKRGWVEKERYKGAATWVDAAEYNRRYQRAESFREKERAREQELAELRSQVAELRKVQQASEEARQKITHQSLLAERAEALAEQNYQRVVQIDDQLLEMKVAAHAPKQQPQSLTDQAMAQTIQTFFANNPAFNDPKMQKALAIAAKELREIDPNAPGYSILEEAKDLVERRYPERFKAAAPPAPRRPAMAEMNGSPANVRTGSKGWNDLKPEVRQQLDAFIKDAPQLAALGVEKARAEVLKNASDAFFRG